MVANKLNRLVALALLLAFMTADVIPIIPGGNNNDLINAFPGYSSSEKLKVYHNYLEVFQKSYGSPNDLKDHFTLFTNNLLQIQTHNASHLTYQEGINQFTDMASKEIAANHLGLLSSGLFQPSN